MAGSLMLKPLKKAAVERCLKDSFKAFAARFESPDTEEVFVAENREGRWRIPYNRILFFESRDKKIFLYTEDQEIGFYGTLDELEDKLPDSFLRCHRSYILSRSKIRCLVPGKNSIQLEDDTLIPVSRSYRNIMKELRGKG
jgi:DNA-binding LytR/AlgR family response regulator